MVSLQVIEMFDSIQGEGYWTGVPMTFVRLAGCNAPDLGLACVRWCDTPASWTGGAGAGLQPVAILDRAHFPHLCLTGGEPLLQAGGLVVLVAEAQRRGIKVHVETNGTVDPPAIVEESLFDWVVVSPKPPEYFVAPGWEGLVDELKLVADELLDAAAAERLAARHPEAVVSIQPLWDDRPSEARAIGLVIDHPVWRLSLQTHKYLGIR